MVLDDARKYIIPIVAAELIDNVVRIDTAKFLGTAFFVTRNGDAITAAHVIMPPDSLQENYRLFAVIQEDGKESWRFVIQSAIFQDIDFALIKIDVRENLHLQISDQEVIGGDDIVVIGIPSHETVGRGKEMRVLKGHVTFVHKRLELNIPIPAGMSGSPVFKKGKVVAFATGRVRSDIIEEQTEEIIEETNQREKIRINTISSIVYYGTAHAISILSNRCDPIFRGKTVIEYINDQNVSPKK